MKLNTTEGETALFRSIIKYRPRGFNRHFSMIGICKDLEKELNEVIPSNEIWKTIKTCYNLDLFNEMEPDDPDEITDKTKTTIEILNLKNSFFIEFQLPININNSNSNCKSNSNEITFLNLINQRRLETNNNNINQVENQLSPTRTKRKTLNSSSKIHQDFQQQNLITNNNNNNNLNLNSSIIKSNSNIDHGLVEDTMDSDLTEQEDYDEDNDDDEYHHKFKEEDEDDDSSPEPKNKKIKISKNQNNESNSTTTTTTTSKTHVNKLRHNNNTINLINSTSNQHNNLVRSNRSSNRTRWKK